MPFKSKAQQKYMEANAGGKVPGKVVKEFENATKAKPGGFKSLPEKAKGKKK